MAYSSKTWAKVKTDYESGNFSVLELSKKYTISEPAIKNRIYGEKWVKGSLKPQIEAMTQETMKEKFARLGVPEDKVLKKVAELLDENPKAGLDYYFKLVGSYAPVKREITGKDGEKLIPEDISLSNIKDELRELLGDKS